MKKQILAAIFFLSLIILITVIGYKKLNLSSFSQEKVQAQVSSPSADDTWEDFRVTMHRAVAAFEADRLGITEVYQPKYHSVTHLSDWVNEARVYTLEEGFSFINQALDDPVATKSADGKWSWFAANGWYGASHTSHVALPLTYIYNRYRDKLPADLLVRVEDRLSNLWWANYWPSSLTDFLLSNNIGADIIAAQILYAEAANDQVMLNYAYDQFNRFYDQIKWWGHYEHTSPSYASYNYHTWALLASQSTNEEVREKARIIQDSILLHSIHLYLPGRGLFRALGRTYAGTAKLGYASYEMWFYTGDPAISSIDTNWGQLYLAAGSNYRPPDYLVEIIKTGYSQDLEIQQVAWEGLHYKYLLRSPKPIPEGWWPNFTGTTRTDMELPIHHYILKDGIAGLG